MNTLTNGEGPFKLIQGKGSKRQGGFNTLAEYPTKITNYQNYKKQTHIPTLNRRLTRWGDFTRSLSTPVYFVLEFSILRFLVSFYHGYWFFFMQLGNLNLRTKKKQSLCSFVFLFFVSDSISLCFRSIPDSFPSCVLLSPFCAFIV